MARRKPTRSAGMFGIDTIRSENVPEAEADSPPVTPAADDAPAAPAPAPEPTPVAQPPAEQQPRPVRRSTFTRATPPSPESTGGRGSVALEGLHPEGGGGATPAGPHPDVRRIDADYATPAWHPRAKDSTSATSTALIEEMSAVQHEWTAMNRARLSSRSQPAPTNSGFREALLRLGLKHLNDPEFIDLIPPDARRKQR